MACSPYVVIVEFTLKPSASKSEGKRLLVENASASLWNEPGCHRFDVVETSDACALTMLYEIYEDEAAFNDHLNTAHYREFSAAADQIFEDKNIRLGVLASDQDSYRERSRNG